MGAGSGRHASLAEKLIEWWEDLWRRGMTSRVVLVTVPPGWGRTMALDRLAKTAEADDAPVTLVARIPGKKLPEKVGAQAAELQERLIEAAERHPVAELLELDRLAGITAIGLGIGSLFVPGLVAGLGFLAGVVTAGAAGKAWDDSPAGADGLVARTARAVAAASVRVPVVVLIDDAEWLDERLAVTLIENLAARHDGHVLVVVAVNPDSGLSEVLTSRGRMGITEGRVHVADADPDMGYESRLALVRNLRPSLPDTAARRIGHATATFSDVFTVTAAPRLAEITADDPAQALEAVDAVLRARLRRPDPTPEAVIIAWAGGLLHARQAVRALDAAGLPRAADDADVLRWDGLERVEDPDSLRLVGQISALAMRDRQAMAEVMAEEALLIAADPDCGLVERMAAAQAAHRVRGDLAVVGQLPSLQRELVATLEALSEPDAALHVATDALEAWPPGGRSADRDWLEAAALRLSWLTAQSRQPPLVAGLITEATAGGAALGLEARIWAAISLLGMNGQREAALDLTDHATAILDEHAVALGATGDQWRLLLALHAGRSGYPAATEQLLAPLLSSGDQGREDAARIVLRAGTGPGADTRLQNILLEAELAALPPGADDDRLRIHHALAANHEALGEYHQALNHGQHELSVRSRIQSPGHPDVFITRNNVAHWIGECGDVAGALRLFLELLPDQERVLGLHHPQTLTTRVNITRCTRDCGDVAAALRLARELLPDLERVLGPHHPHTLNIRSNIAGCTGECGDTARALRLFLELLPDLERVLGPDHPHTLGTRSDIAYSTGKCGDTARALRLFLELLPDQERVLGPEHPDTLITRCNIMARTGECGDAAGALRLAQELLPDLGRVLGPDAADTLTTRNYITYWSTRVSHGSR